MSLERTDCDGDASALKMMVTGKNMNSSSSSNNNDDELQKQAVVLRAFAFLLSAHRYYTTEEVNATCTSTAYLEQQQAELPRLFAETNEEGEEDGRQEAQSVFCCTVPCLQARSGHGTTTTTTTTTNIAQKSPLMSSSSSCMPPPENVFLRRSTCNTTTTTTTSTTYTTPAAHLSPTTLEVITAKSLGKPIHRTRKQVADLPGQLLSNCTRTFEILWQARLRQAAKALLSRGCNNFEAVTSACLLASLAGSQPSVVVTVFKTLDFVDRCVTRNPNPNRLPTTKDNEDESASSSSSLPLEESVVVVPVVLQVMMDWTMPNSATSFTTRSMEAPGIVQGQFVVGDSQADSFLLRSVVIELDTGALLVSMMKQAKLIVRHALVAAACQARPLCTTNLPLAPFQNQTWRLDQSQIVVPPQGHSSSSSSRQLPELRTDRGLQATNVAIADALGHAASIMGDGGCDQKTPFEALCQTLRPNQWVSSFKAVPIDVASGVALIPTTDKLVARAEHPHMPPPPSKRAAPSSSPEARREGDGSGKRVALSTTTTREV